MVKIYKLIDPRDNRVFYVGKTESLLTNRLKHHIYESKKNKRTDKQKLILEILDSGHTPLIKTLKRIKKNTKQRWQDLERYYIKKFDNLTNLDSGGGGGDMNEKTKIKISNRMTGRKLSTKHRTNISNSKKGKPLSTKHKKALKKNHKGNTGRKFSDEHKANISKSLKGISRPMKDSVKEARTGANNPRSQKIKGVNTLTGEVLYYDSTGVAYRDLKSKGIRISRSSIIKNLKDSSLSAGGYKWYKI